jgi:hypothetical protein
MSDKSFLDTFGKSIPNDRPAGIDELAKVLAEERGAAVAGNAAPPTKQGSLPSSEPASTERMQEGEGDASGFKAEFQRRRSAGRGQGKAEVFSVRLPIDAREVFYRYAATHGVSLQQAVMAAAKRLDEEMDLPNGS